MGRGMLERERELAELGAAAREAKDGDGSVVLLVGEAGIGKSSLVQSIRSVLPAEGRLLVGYCDDLATPRVLGPLRDLVGSVGVTLDRALSSGDRSQVIDAIRAELDWPDHPTMLVVEDVHWADEATLDVLRFLVRRISSMPVVLVLTYRDDEVTRDHPLQTLLGLASGTPRLRRLARLTPDAVRQLGADTGLDPAEVYAVTSGNPFFVAEVLASGDVHGVPPTIAEAVRARLDHLDRSTRDALEQLAVVPSAVERWLVDAAVPGGLAALAAAEQRGVLTVSVQRVAFRHELARRAVVDSMPAIARVTCNQSILAALLGRTGGVDLSRILHHAVEVGEEAVIVRYGPAAAREAVTAGSHREAVAHYRLVLDHCSAFPPAEQAELFQAYAIECYTLGLADLAVTAQKEAVRLRRELDDPRTLATALRWLSRIHWWAGERGEAETVGSEAVDVSEASGDRSTLALAFSNQSQLHALAGRPQESIAVGERAIAMAREMGDAGTLSHALNNVGFAYWDNGRPDAGRALLDESLEVALGAGEIDHACRAYVNIAWHLIDDLRLEEADHILDDAIELAEEAEFLGFLRYMHLTRGIINLERGVWAEAEREAAWTIDAQPQMRCPALIVTGRARIRRGDGDGEKLLELAWAIAERIGEAQRIGPAAAALAEAAWLRGDMAAVVAAAAPVYERLRPLGGRYNVPELGYWLWAAGSPVPMVEVDHPYVLQTAGRWREAADRWRRAGCPYEYARTLADSPDPDDLLTALATLDGMGAEPLARRVRGRLKELGVTRVPRGPVPSTRENPAGLTGRQVEVVRLLADGLSNAEIAARLVLSVRTVDSHVAAVLYKLGAPTRREAVARARSLGLVSGV